MSIHRAVRRWLVLVFLLPCGGSAVTFEEWQQSHFDTNELANENISGPLADPEKDGRGNLMEYAMGSDPSASDASPTSFEVNFNAAFLSLTFAEAAGIQDLEWLFQSSPDLKHWITHNAVVESARIPGSGFDTVTVELPLPSGPPGKQFARIKIDLDPIELLRSPTSVTATPTSTTSARIEWNDNCNIELGQQIERRLPDVSGWELVGTVANDVITFIDSPLPFQAGWEYRVVALGPNSTTAASAGAIIGTFVDTDQDGIPDSAELDDAYTGTPGTFPTDPNNAYSNASNVPDGWYAANGFDPITHDSHAQDSDNDGLNDYEEYLTGTNPNAEDTDGDTLLDGEEAVPLHPAMRAPAAAESRYAIIDLGESDSVGFPSGLNDKGEVLLISTTFQPGQYTVSGALWSSGTMTTVGTTIMPNGDARSIFFGPLADGSVYYSSTAVTTSPPEELPITTRADMYHWTAASGASQDGVAYQSWMSAARSFVHPSRLTQIVENPAQIAFASALSSSEAQMEAYYLSHFGPLDEEDPPHGTADSSAIVMAFNDAQARMIMAEGSSDVNPGTPIMGSSSYSSIAAWTGHNLPPFWRAEYFDYFGDEGFGKKKVGQEVRTILVNGDNFCAYDWKLEHPQTQGAVLVGETTKNIPLCAFVYDLNLKGDLDEGPYLLGARSEGTVGLWCYNNGSFANVDIGSEIIGVGNVVGRNVSNSLVVPLMDKLWRNSRLHNMADVCTSAEKWGQYSVSLVSPHANLLAGTAKQVKNDLGEPIPPAQQENHALLLLPFGLEIDSDNNNEFELPTGSITEREERGEEDNDEKPGKVLLTNHSDRDGDGIPDYADGFDLHAEITQDDTSLDARFIPFVLRLTALNWDNARIRFQYDASDPTLVTQTLTTPYVLPEQGKIRLWKKDAGEERNKDPLNEEGDYIKPNVSYTLEELGLSQNQDEVTLYVEAVKESAETANIEIKVELDPSGTMGFAQVTDAVRVTATRVELFSRGADGTQFEEADRLVASQLEVEEGQQQITLEPYLLEAEIGGSTGAASITAEGYQLTSQSTGIGGTQDAFHLLYYVENGDFDIKAQVYSLQNAVGTTKAGLMVRTGAENDAPFALVGVTGGNQYTFEHRTVAGQSVAQIAGGAVSTASWVRLVRQASVIRAYKSNDGQSWQQIGSDLTLSMEGGILSGMFLASGGANTATAEFRQVELPLTSSTLTISDELTPGSYATYKVRIFDPRQSELDDIKINEDTVLLSNASTYWESAEFICAAPSEQTELPGAPSTIVRITDQPMPFEYNPSWFFNSDPKLKPTPTGYPVVADLIKQATESMKNGGWTGTNDGAFGSEIHDRVGDKLQNQRGWLVNVTVDNATNEIRAIGYNLPPGQNLNTTQIDLLHVNNNYRPQIGDILNANQVIDLYDVKTSLAGGMGSAQKARLKAVIGGRDIVIAKSEWRWTSAKGWHKNHLFGAGYRFLAVLGGGTVAYAWLNYSDYDDELIALRTEVMRIRQSDDAMEKKLMAIGVLQMLKNYLAHFMLDTTELDIVSLGLMYKILGDESFTEE